MTTDYLGASAGAVQHHYDRGREFYRLWLDPSMTYSCGMWDQAGTLDEAQTRKLDFHAREAGAIGAGRVLDVGCGWGSMLRRLVVTHGVQHAVGLTLSADQHAHVADLQLPNVDVRLENWADHAVSEPYDAAISIGALEHFAHVDHCTEEKVRAYRRFFECMHELLRPGARLSVQTIIFGTLDELDPWISEQIWPESNLPRLPEVVAAADRCFEIEAMRNDRLDYARTCTAWADTMCERAEAVTAVCGQDMFADYVRYLRMSAKAFETGAMGLIRMRLSRNA